jgi:hypothetical protein
LGRPNWNLISQYRKLSEDFIQEFKDTVTWQKIINYQGLSEDFLEEFKDKIY